MNMCFGKGKLDSISDRGGVVNPFHNSVLTAVLQNQTAVCLFILYISLEFISKTMDHDLI